MSKSSIEWTEATWNPIVGCSILSPGCTNCYAMKMASRIEAMSESFSPSHGTAPQYRGTTKKVNGNAIWTGKIAMAADNILLQPLRRKKPTTYFVNSMGDLFHEGCPDEWIDKVFAVMALSPQHTFQVLTKRAKRMRDYVSARNEPALRLPITGSMNMMGAGATAPIGHRMWPLPNVWLGVSTERQQEADERIPLLLQTPAAVRFISAEPLLGPIDLGPLHLLEPMYGQQGLDWVIVGGESGPNARPMQPNWARSLRRQCEEAGVPFFFKQWGEYGPVNETEMCRLGKKRAGRALDGIEYNQMPECL